MKRPRREVSCYRGGITRVRESVLLIAAAVCLLAAGLCGFLLPGVRFSGVLFAALAALCLLEIVLGRWASRSAAGQFCNRLVLSLLGLALLLFVAVEGCILHDGNRTPSDAPVDAVIVLGAGVNGKTPSLTLQTRINAAAEYLKMQPQAVAILSGGQGRGEDISEAQAMYNGLTAKGIAGERLHLEEKSTSTAENFEYSKALLEELGLSPIHSRLALVTNDFHVFRAHLIAVSQGVVLLEDVPADLPWWWLSANYHVREFFALGKLAAMQLLA